jgi:hypothetical protein
MGSFTIPLRTRSFSSVHIPQISFQGWFYTLLVLSTYLFGAAPLENLIAMGLVLTAYVLLFSYSLQPTVYSAMARK